MTGRTKGAASGVPAEPICRRLLDIEQGAYEEGVAVEWICHRIMAGELPIYHLAGGPRIDEVELARILAAYRSKRR